MRKHFFIFSFFILLFSCNSEQKSLVDVSTIEVNFSIDRFDVDFYTAKENSLTRVKEKYPLFFPKDTPDTVWVHKINNKDEQELFSETQKIYQNVDFIEKKIEQLFKHVKYYYPNFSTPKVVTLLSNIDYQNRVIYSNNHMLISLDVYLGGNHPFYSDYPIYVKQNFTKEHIIVDVAQRIIDTKFLNNFSRSFVDKMIEEGKKLYMLDKFLPMEKDFEKIGYSIEKLKWAKSNEEQVWKYFIENKLLFSTETKLNKRFMDLAPFSKFYREDDNLSPGRIGAWVGWQIVSSYMSHNDVSLQQLLQLQPSEIFNKSKYKPKK